MPKNGYVRMIHAIKLIPNSMKYKKNDKIDIEKKKDIEGFGYKNEPMSTLVPRSHYSYVVIHDSMAFKGIQESSKAKYMNIQVLY